MLLKLRYNAMKLLRLLTLEIAPKLSSTTAIPFYTRVISPQRGTAPVSEASDQLEESSPEIVGSES
jgi:hypothetical protein